MGKAERFSDIVSVHGEGPVYSESWGGLHFVDMLDGDVVAVDDTGHETSRTHLGTIAAAIRPRSGGGCVAATEHGFAVFDSFGTAPVLTAQAFADPAIRLNEGACDPFGNFWCGSMAYDQTPGAASMYRFRPDGTVETMWGNITTSNGLQFTPTGDGAYYIDSQTRRIDYFDVDDRGELSGRRPWVTIEEGAGWPDGLCLDVEGGIWVALYGGSAVRRYDDAGTLNEVVEVGAQQVTACTLGGASGTELFITTSRENKAPGEDPQAGSLFRWGAGVAGYAPYEFGRA